MAWGIGVGSRSQQAGPRKLAERAGLDRRAAGRGARGGRSGSLEDLARIGQSGPSSTRVGNRSSIATSESDRADRSIGTLPVQGEQERHAGVKLEVRGLGPQAVLAQVVSVVAHEDHHRPRGGAAPVERVEHLAELSVHVTDVGEVSMANLGGLLGGERQLLGRHAAELCGERGRRAPAPSRPAGRHQTRGSPAVLVEVPVSAWER